MRSIIAARLLLLTSLKWSIKLSKGQSVVKFVRVQIHEANEVHRLGHKDERNSRIKGQQRIFTSPKDYPLWIILICQLVLIESCIITCIRHAIQVIVISGAL